MTLAEIIADMERAVAQRRETLSPTRGMRVPYLGELASAPPSTIKAVEWWIARLKELA